MSASPASRTDLDFGVARVVNCETCGLLSFTGNEIERASRMAEFHDSFCGHATIERRP